MLAIILIHVTGTFAERAPVDWFTAVLIFANSASRFAVPVFVMLSGFHLSLNARNEQYFRFYRRTLKHLVIPYLLYTALYTLVRGSLQKHQLLSVTEFLSSSTLERRRTRLPLRTSGSYQLSQDCIWSTHSSEVCTVAFLTTDGWSSPSLLLRRR